MKRSEKILLAFFLFSFLAFVVIHLVLYARYHQGDIVTGLENISKKEFPEKDAVPAVLSINGNLNVRIIPSDSFSVEWDQHGEKRVHVRRSGDSLIIDGEHTVTRDQHSLWMQYDNLPWIFVSCGNLKNIQLSDVMATMKGGLVPGRLSLGMEISNTQLVLGRPVELLNALRKFPPDLKDSSGREYYDSLDIHAINSNLVLNANIAVHALRVQLDDRSELQDLHAAIDRPEIQYSDHSRITLSGVTLKKLK
jgi:hypothetical protein